MTRSEGLTPPNKKSPYYYCHFYYIDKNGKEKRERKSTKQTDERAAWLAYQRLRAERGCDPDISRDSYTFGSVLMMYEEAKRDSLRSQRAYTSSVKALNRFYAFSTPWDEICNRRGALFIQKYVDFRRGKDGEGVKDSTIRREIGVLSAAINFAADEYELDIRNPCRRTDLRVKKPPVFWLTVEQVKDLLAAARRSPTAIKNDFALYDYINIAVNTGMRPGEVLGLSRRMIVRKVMYLEETKNGKSHQVPVHPDIEASIARRLAFAAKVGSDLLFINPKTGRAYTTFISPMRRACREAGIPLSDDESKGMTPYGLRHTFASQLVRAGVDLYKVMDLLNHSDIKMTLIYAHLRPDGRQQAIEMLDFSID